MVRIRLRRVGSKKQPHYRVVAADKEAPRDGRFLEILGYYNPRTQPETIHFEEDRIYHWLSVGAQPTESVQKLFKIMGLMERYERYKAGESLEALLEEAAEVEAARNVNPKTEYAAAQRKPKQQEKQAEEKAEVASEEQE